MMMEQELLKPFVASEVGRLRPCDDGYQVTFDNKTFATVHLTRAQVVSVCRVVGFLRMED